MFDIPSIAFDPLLPIAIIYSLTALALVGAIWRAWGRLRSWVARCLATGVICLALLNPQTVEEDREPLADEVLVLKDASDSMQVGDRAEQLEAVYTALVEQLESDPSLSVTTALVQTEVNGTPLTGSLIESLGNLPQSRLAGIVALTDGQIHDLPDTPENIYRMACRFMRLLLVTRRQGIDALVPF